jgi:hypothetical protein
MFNFTNEQQLTILRALSQYGKDLAENGVDTKTVLALIADFSFSADLWEMAHHE